MTLKINAIYPCELHLPVPRSLRGWVSTALSQKRRQPTTFHYSRVPQRVPRGFNALERVGCLLFKFPGISLADAAPARFSILVHCNLVLDSAILTKPLDLCVYKDERTFTHMRYSAATCDPNGFKDDGFTFRQVHCDLPRRTELFIVMAMYNEDDGQFTMTMHGVMKDVAYLYTRDHNKTWGKDRWKKVVICIVNDCRQRINSRTLSGIGHRRVSGRHCD